MNLTRKVVQFKEIKISEEKFFENFGFTGKVKLKKFWVGKILGRSGSLETSVNLARGEKRRLSSGLKLDFGCFVHRMMKNIIKMG